MLWVPHSNLITRYILNPNSWEASLVLNSTNFHKVWYLHKHLIVVKSYVVEEVSRNQRHYKLTSSSNNFGSNLKKKILLMVCKMSHFPIKYYWSSKKKFRFTESSWKTKHYKEKVQCKSWPFLLSQCRLSSLLEKGCKLLNWKGIFFSPER